jgi:chorismate mutase
MQKNKAITAQDQKALKKVRDTIDSADQAILKALGARFKAVEKVGKIKRKYDMPLYQKARWQEVVEDRLNLAQKQKVAEPFTRALLKLIHKEAIRIQKGKI